jgi:hypothetical protein
MAVKSHHQTSVKLQYRFCLNSSLVNFGENGSISVSGKKGLTRDLTMRVMNFVFIRFGIWKNCACFHQNTTVAEASLYSEA